MSSVNLAHVRIQGVNCAIFDADATSRTSSARSSLLSRLTLAARHAGLRIEKSALAYADSDRLNFFGSRDLVQYLADAGLPDWTHTIQM